MNQRRSRRSQLGVAPASDEQRRTHSGLQLLDVQADGGRRQMQRLRGGGERAQIGDRNEGLELIQIEVTHQYF